MAQKGGIVVLSDACIADALSVVMGTFSAGVDANSPKMFPTAAELQSIVAPPLCVASSSTFQQSIIKQDCIFIVMARVAGHT